MAGTEVSVTPRLEIVPLSGLEEIAPDDQLGALLVAAARSAGLELDDGDVVVISHKVVSKAEGRVRDLADVEPGTRARELGAALDKDPRLVQVILDESRAVIRAERGALIVETRGGWICANAGVDASNVPGDDSVALLPSDPDLSARRIRDELAGGGGGRPAVVISDSFGRPWRLGQADVAIGCAGLAPLDDWRGRTDHEGRELAATVVAVADEVAAATDLVRGKDTGIPACLVRGLGRFVSAQDGPGARAIQRPEAEDLFR
jgi:coenzyme F420-0:L-glutamate ligase/coenzyme F420-1:gamma-L-glutamate ligase